MRFLLYAKNPLFITVLVVFGNVLFKLILSLMDLPSWIFQEKPEIFFSGPFNNDDSGFVTMIPQYRAVF